MTMIAVTPKLHVEVSRYHEWLAGTRPLPGQDERAFFRSAVDVGRLTERQAVELLERHQRLSAIEDGAA